jgi:hypothetical protein
MTIRHTTTGPVQSQRHNPRGGVALIMTLGLLAVLTLLAVAFAIAMRVESIAARNYANLVRARHLVYTSLTRAIDDIDRTCGGANYPDWDLYLPNGVRDALASGWDGSALTNICEFMSGEATNSIAPVLLSEAEAVTAYWRNVLVNNMIDGSSVAQTNGRIAYLIVNSSGLLDANFIGGQPRVDSETIREIDISYLMPGTAAGTFVTNRETLHRRYETLQETYGITVADPAIAQVLFPISYDPGPDVYLANTNNLGKRNAVLIPKFEINSITNFLTNATFYSAWHYGTPYPGDGSDFWKLYMTPLMEMFKTALPDMLDTDGKRRDVAWSFVNYLDPNRVPQNSEEYPYRHTEGSECVPTINEVVFDGAPGAYRFQVELWYPFIPVNVQPSDGFKLEIGVFANNWRNAAAPPQTLGPPVPNERDIMNFARHRQLFDIDEMTFGTASEFKVFSTDPFPPPLNPAAPISATNAVWFLARVLKVDSASGSTVTHIVDEAMGYRRSEEQGGAVHRRALKKFDVAPVSYQINDPRINGQCRYWDPTSGGGVGYSYFTRIGRRYGGGGSAPAFAHTLGADGKGALNDKDYFTYFKTPKSQGFPIFFRNDLMKNIGEIGHIFRTNMDDEKPYDTALYSDYAFWRSIDLMNRVEGAKLLDWITVRSTNVPCRGRITISTRQTNTLYSLVHGLHPADTDGDGETDWGPFMGEMRPVQAAAIANLVKAIQDRADMLGGCKQWQDLFDAGTSYLVPNEPLDDGGPVARAMRKCIDDVMGTVPGFPYAPTNKVLQEAVARSVIELLSFRQNIFTVLVAGQSLARNGTTVVAEQRAVVTVVRDAYTGRYFIRNFKWLSD